MLEAQYAFTGSLRGFVPGYPWPSWAHRSLALRGVRRARRPGRPLARGRRWSGSRLTARPASSSGATGSKRSSARCLRRATAAAGWHPGRAPALRSPRRSTSTRWRPVAAPAGTGWRQPRTAASRACARSGARAPWFCSAARASWTASRCCGLRLEDKLAALAAEIERATTAGDEDAAEAAHARYIELGTTYVAALRGPAIERPPEHLPAATSRRGSRSSSPSTACSSRGEEVLALVSGGADSLCLWGVLKELGYPVEALHVEHGLRGAEGLADAAHCAALGATVVPGRPARTGRTSRPAPARPATPPPASTRPAGRSRPATR